MWHIGFTDGSGQGQDGEGIWITDGNDKTIISGGKDDWGVPIGITDIEVARLIVNLVNNHHFKGESK